MKVVNFVLGLATAVILGALIVLGISAFYPMPATPPNPPMPPAPVGSLIVPCSSNDTACTQNNAKIEAQQQAANTQYGNAMSAYGNTYDNEMSVYFRNLFIIANVVGIIFFAVGFWLVFGVALASNAVPVGIMLAGLWSIIYGYTRGSGSVDDQLKFFIGLVIAVLIIGGSMWLIQRYQKKQFAKA